VIIEILELYLRRGSPSIFLMNEETADFRDSHRDPEDESFSDIEPLLSNIRI
jgi:hypothetical protein